MKKFSEIPQNVLDQLETMAEDFFDTKNDADQMPVTVETQEKLSSLTPYWLNYAVSNTGEVVSSTVIVPTQKDLAEKFLNKEINERELMDQTNPSDHYSAIYLCSAITIPGYRNQGFVKKLFLESIKNVPTTDDVIFVTWPTTELGEQSAGSSHSLPVPILVRKG